MNIEIKTPVTKEKVQEAINQLANESIKKSLRRHFGKLKRNMDGLDYQKQVRNEWVSFVADTNFLIDIHEGKKES